ncbi:hypothetical protein M0R45_013494 [Rubus argutus]|uniref:Uncharacterized protein n=1 Tax=Rubus argutus TaxID=59490 RepID=A0AAW1XIL6_RUBAR
MIAKQRCILWLEFLLELRFCASSLSFLAFFGWKGCLVDSETSREEALRGLDLQTGFFTLRQIKAATNNFDPINKIGKVVLVVSTRGYYWMALQLQ